MMTVELDSDKLDEAMAASGYSSGSELALCLFTTKPLGERIGAVMNGEGTEAENEAAEDYYATPDWKDRYTQGDEEHILVRVPLTRAAISYWRRSGIPAERLLQVASLLSVKPGSLVTDDCREFLRTLID